MAKISVNKVLDKKDSTITKAETDLIDDFTGIENQIYNAVNRLATKMNQSDGKILFDDENTQAVNEINEVVRKAIQSSQYPTKVKDYLRNFETIKQFNFDIHQDVNDLNPDELDDLINPVQRGIVEQTLTNLTGAGINTNFSDPLREGIFKNIVAGTTISDLQTYLQSYINTNPERMGQLKKYVSQVSRDALNQFDGQVNSRIAEEFGLNAFRYVGSIIDDSRPQCIRWVGKEVLLLDELSNEISWAYSNGTGMIPGTTKDNFAVYRGGYNCRHSAIPFKLTKSQRAELEKQSVIEKQAEPIETKQNQTVAGLTRAQQELNLTFGESKLTPKILNGMNVPDQIFILSNNLDPTSIDFDQSFYDARNKKIMLDLESERSNKSNYQKTKVIIHEYAHRTHHEKKLITFSSMATPENYQTEKQFRKSKELFEDKIGNEKLDQFRNKGISYDDYQDWKWYEKTAKKYYGKIKGFSDNDIDELTISYLDTISSLTDGLLGCGHETDYWKITNNNKAEWFAHASENYWQGNPVFEAEFPELYNQMNDYYKKNVIDQFLKDYLK